MATHRYTPGDLPELLLDSWPPTIETVVRGRFTEVLTGYVLGRRWYRSKARQVQSSRIADVIAPPGGEWIAVLIELTFERGEREVYFCTLAAEFGETEPASAMAKIALPDGSHGILAEALDNPAFSGALLDAIAAEQSFQGSEGLLRACHTTVFDQFAGSSHPSLPARASKAEQSNSSILYGDRFILKIYRRLEPGVNPDFEIGRFLTERAFRHTPAVAGHIEYRGAGSAPMSACILQQFVPNQGDAWEFTLESAREFYSRNRRGVAPPLASEHPTEGSNEQAVAQARRVVGKYMEAAELLGECTAEMHIALADPNAGPQFSPEPFTDQLLSDLRQSLLHQMDMTFGLVREKQTTFEGRVAADARGLLQIESRIAARFHEVTEHPIRAMRIRHHGDYHLGQVLYTGADFAIIDFEGEPARPLEERRQKRAAMRDVAGMLRSFQYAAYSALAGADQTANAEGWADYWATVVGQAFFRSYLDIAGGHAFLPDDPRERRMLLDVFLLEKALYEVAYELNNRPEWVRIPLRGIFSLMA